MPHHPPVSDPPPAPSEGPTVASSLPHLAFDRAGGASGEVWVVLASDSANVCANIQHGADAKATLARATVAVVPRGSESPLNLAAGPRSGGSRHEAAGALRMALAGSPPRGTVVDVVDGRPVAARPLPEHAAGAGKKVLPCPGLTAYIRSWLDSAAARRPPPAQRRKARAPDAAAAPKG